ncbi:prepilin-type N-terminal cleavage/methylation domain-containing protein [Patescibacteria group bacterium]|nr:MAG: prepilin-type N-terminal cleavage/methylation domain-containing protein [Patescibacteria group bacterium]
MFKSFKKTNSAGFSLIESLIATAIFVVVVAIGAGVFLTVSRAQHKAISVSEAQKDTRFALEAIVKEVRMGTIDFKYYEDNKIDLEGEVNELAIYGSSKEYLVFRKVGGDQEGGQLEVAINPSYQKLPGNFQSMIRENVEIKKLSFYISPSESPYKEGGEKKQPRVTIILQSEVKDQDDPVKTVKIDLQTTVTSRVYK